MRSPYGYPSAPYGSLATSWEPRYRNALLFSIWNSDPMANIDKDPTKGLNAAVAAELRAERMAQEVAFDDLVERVSLSRATTWRLLNAERLITIEALVEVAGALGVSVLEIVERAERRLARETPPPRKNRRALAFT